MLRPNSVFALTVANSVLALTVIKTLTKFDVMLLRIVL